MKKFKLLLLLIGLIYLGCSKEEITTIGQQGNYAANFDFPTGVVNVPAKVVLTNRSKNADKYRWEYTGGKTLNKSGLSDVSVSEKMVPDTIFYELPGEYTVKLTTWQGDKAQEVSKKITLVKMQPRIIVPANIAVFEDVQFDAKAFNYPGQPVTYSWDFGAAGTSNIKNPVVRFTTDGEHIVKLTVNDGQETITVEAKVQVKGELAKTIYFTDVVTKKIYAYKLTTSTPSTPIALPGITTGVSPLGLSVSGNKIYYSEAGLGLRFSTGVNADGDGYLKSFNLDGTGEKIITRNTGTGAYNVDPWLHTVDKDGNIWWGTRNNGVHVINASSTEAPYPAFRIRGVTSTGFSSSSHFYSGIREVGDEIWVSFTGNGGRGLHKFKKTGEFVSEITNLKDIGIRQFVVDSKNNHIYLAINRATAYEPGIYRCNMDGSNIVAVYNTPSAMGFTAATGFSDQGYVGTAAFPSGEAIYVTGMELDQDDDGKGYLYFGYRNRTDSFGTNAPQSVGSGANSGIMRYKLDGTQPAGFLIKGYAPYGIAIDNVKR